MRTYLCLAVLLLLPARAPAQAQGEARLLRFPAVHGPQLVFTYAGNLYTVASTGGIARQLTSHDGFEMFARFSPDGKTLAFTAQYDGNTEVYVMPSEGGVPKRLTYTATLKRDDVSDRMGPNNIVMAWTPDGKHIVFRSRMNEPNDFIGQLFRVSATGGLQTQLPLPRGGFCSFSPDGKKLAYNRIFREFRTWKRYRGGMANDVWIYDFETKKTVNITDNPACDTFPMWSGHKVYFLSDRDEHKRFNLFLYDVDTKETKQLTQFTDFDIKYPSLGNDAIVFENGGYIYRFDLAAQQHKKVPIRILEDQALARTALRDVSKNVASFEIAPDGKRALFSARGDLFTVPAKHGATRNLTATPGVHERNPKWSHDGKQIAFISDASGEDEIHVIPQEGGASKQLTSNGDTYKYALTWSPDGKKLLWADKKLRLQYVDAATKQVKLVAQGKAWEIRSYAWSPDSKWVAYAKPETAGLQKVYIYSLEKDKSYEVTDGWYASFEPIFSADGKYLYFVSNRDFNPIFSRTEWNHAYQDMARIYLVTLAKDTPSPFKPKSDEVGSGKEEKQPAKGKEDKAGKEPKKKTPVVVKVDVDGLSDRVLQLPVPVATYFSLTSVGGNIYYMRQSAKDPKATLHVFDLAQEKETSLGQIGGYEISADGKKMLVSKDSKYYLVDLPKAPLSLQDPLDLSGMQVQLDRRAEWRQIYNECWRQMRDFFYDPHLHGVHWKALRERYAPLVEHVAHRADLTYVIGELIGELNAGHAYVGGGDMPKAARIPLGLLGAELEQDAATKYYKIKRILKGANWNKTLRSPLTEIGVNVKEGEYLVAVNGRPTNEMANIYESLVNMVGKQVKLKVSAAPKMQGSREVIITPIGDEHPLYYYDWVQKNLKHVTEATNGDVGYLHVPDMLANGLNEFVKYFYPQLRKKALIIDMRGNGGGNVSPQLIERLRRQIALVDIARNTSPAPDPFDQQLGPKVCLLNEFSASDGDLFPFRFRHSKLGKLIGKRSWGGVIGIRGSLPLLDGGYLNKPEFASYSVDGKTWPIEGHGVDPDIIVDNDPAREYAGTDEQLERAIREITEELRATRGHSHPRRRTRNAESHWRDNPSPFAVAVATSGSLVSPQASRLWPREDGLTSEPLVATATRAAPDRRSAIDLPQRLLTIASARSPRSCWPPATRLQQSHLMEEHLMIRLALRLCPLAVALALGVAGTRPAAAGDKDGFMPLFNGKDMSGFKYILGNKEGDDPLKTPTKTWRIEDGVIICKGNPNGYFYTDKSYKNYVVRFDWKYKRPANLQDDEKFGGNSGLLVHIEGKQKVWPKCVEVQGMNREHGKIFAIVGGKGKFTFDAAALKKARHKVGEWNTTEVTVQNGMITSKVNGTEVATGMTTNLTEGPFGLQSEGAEIHFKNIKVKILK